MQREFNFEKRGDQQRAVKAAQLTRIAGIHPPTLKAVLMMIDDYGRGGECFLAHKTIAAEVQCSERQARRCTKALQNVLKLITCEKRLTELGFVCNHYGIVWGELRRFLPGATVRPNEARPFGQMESTIRPNDGGAFGQMTGDHSAKCERPYKEAQEAQDPPSPKDWTEVGAKLREAGVGEFRAVISRAIGRGESPAAFAARIDEGLATIALPANRGKFESPVGALVYWLDHDVWPRPGIASLASQAAAAAALELRERNNAATAIVRDGRSRGASDDAIAEALRKRGLELPGRNVAAMP